MNSIFNYLSFNMKEEIKENLVENDNQDDKDEITPEIDIEDFYRCQKCNEIPIIKINNEWYVVLALKKGVFSILVVLLLYNFFYVIICLRMNNYFLEETRDPESVKSFIRGTGISFSIIIGILTYIFAFFFKDLMSLFVMFLIYVGLLISFFNYDGPNETQRENLLKYTDGVIDILMMVITIAIFVFLGLKYDSFLL